MAQKKAPMNLVVEPSEYGMVTGSYVADLPLVAGAKLTAGEMVRCTIKIAANQGRTTYRLYNYHYTVALINGTNISGDTLTVNFAWRVNPNGESLLLSMSPAGIGVKLESITLIRL